MTAFVPLVPLVAVALTVGFAATLVAVVPPLNAVPLGFFVAFLVEVVAVALCGRAAEAWGSLDGPP